MTISKLIIASIMITVAVDRVHAAEPCVPVEAVMRSQVQSELSRRAIKIVQMSRVSNWANNSELRSDVVEAVRVSGGIGHRGLPLPPGLASLHYLASSIDATEFRYTGWDYMDGPYDGCARQEIQVELFNRTSGKLWPIKIEFVNGRATAIQTWEHSEKSGLLSRPDDQ